MKIRFCQFLTGQKCDVPGQAQAADLRASDFDLDFSPSLRVIRYEVLPERQKAGIGVWTDRDGSTIYGLAPVGYIPLERVLRFEALQDEPLAETAPAAKPAGLKSGAALKKQE